ncbi:MAG: hypothetical protein M3032_06540 [Verrucomicrobiota bacterium]|nr:hypothetical protein [Verrucomicrobiota bacterium]
MFIPFLLTSCAYNGVIVRKESRPHPLYHTIGIEGVYSFIVRDTSGSLHRQMVTPEVYEMYAEGQTFNDLGPAPTAAEFKETQPAPAPVMHHPRRPASEAPPLETPRRVSDVPPAVESSQSFRASELQRSSRSLTATMRTEVQHDTPPESDGMQQSHSMGVVTHDEAATAPEKPATKKIEHATAKTSKSAKKAKNGAGKKSAKPWRETEPVVETAPASPSVNASAPADQHPPSSGLDEKPSMTSDSSNPPPR